jgi:hypothetical protein
MLAGAETSLMPSSENAYISRQKLRQEIFMAGNVGLMRGRRNA